jgi:glycosyltransferase involved in cell wall biosynthesis
VFLAQNSIVPCDNGGRIRNHALVTALAARCETTLVLTDPASPGALGDLRRLGASVVVVPKSRLRFWGYALDILRGVPGAFAVQRNRRLDRWVRSRGGEIDVIVAGGLARVPRRPPSDVPIVVDTQNVEHQRFARARSGAAPGWPRLVDRLSTLGLKGFERRVLRRTIAVACSEPDAQSFSDLAIEKTWMVPNGVWCDQYARPVPGPHRVVVVGDLGYGPNREAAEIFLSKIVPAVRGQEPTCEFVIAGRGASDRLKRSASALGVEVRSPVASMADLLQAATIEVVPLARGGGTRLKILEAFAARVPVVSTSIGAEGIPVVDGEHLVLADDMEDLAGEVVRLLRDPERARGLAGAARKLVEDQYDWAGIGERFVQSLLCLHSGESPASGWEVGP